MNYTTCNTESLYEHMQAWLPACAFRRDDSGLCHTRVPCEIVREEVEAYIAECNKARTSADGYELAEDFDQQKAVVTFYVLCEDGSTMCELPVAFDTEVYGIQP